MGGAMKYLPFLRRTGVHGERAEGRPTHEGLDVCVYRRVQGVLMIAPTGVATCCCSGVCDTRKATTHRTHAAEGETVCI